jgi:hypothetical protein
VALIAAQLPYGWPGICSSGWPAAEGVIVWSRVGTGSTRDFAYYEPDVEYCYSVGDQRFRSDRIVYGGVWLTRWLADRVAEKYPIGRKVSVYYDSDNPSRAVLEPGLSGLCMVLIAIGLTLIALGVTIYVRGRRIDARQLQQQRQRQSQMLRSDLEGLKNPHA